MDNKDPENEGTQMPDNEGTQMPDNRKPTYIHEQHNYNCQQFYGPITGCTFMMPPAPAEGSPSPVANATPQPAPSRKKGRADKPKITDATYSYRHHDTQRLIQLYQRLLHGKLIDPKTDPQSFCDIFSGEASASRVKWTASQAMLWYLLKSMMDRQLITLPEGSQIWVVASSHFLDSQGRLFDNGSFRRCKEPKKAVPALDRLVDILDPGTVPQPDMMDDDLSSESWAGIRDRGWDLND